MTMAMKSVVHSLAYGFDFLCEQVADVAPAEMVAQPAGIPNHPAWVVGHLTNTCQLLGSTIGIPEWLPDDFARRFGTRSVPVADARLYDTKDNALALLRDAQSRITRALDRLNDSQLDEPFPDESFRDVFPSIRHALIQVLVGHTAYHVGQLTVWRRAMGLPPLRRSFE